MKTPFKNLCATLFFSLTLIAASALAGDIGVGRTGDIGVGRTGDIGVGRTGDIGVGVTGDIGVGR